MFKWFKHRYTREMRLKNCEERIILLQKEVEHLKTMMHYREPWAPCGQGIEMREAVRAIMNHLKVDIDVELERRKVYLKPWNTFTIKTDNIDGLPECPIKVKEKKK